MNKNTRALIGLISVGALLSAANAAVISSVTALDGVGASFTVTTNVVVNDLTTAVMQSFVADGVTYTPVSAAVSGASYVGDVEGVLYEPGGTAPTVSVALTDGDLGTGGLDPLGDNFTTGDHFKFDSTTFTATTMFYLFSNGTPAGGVQLVDAGGNGISTAINAGVYGGEVQIGGWDYERTNGGDLNNRDVAGVTFSVSDFTFDVDKSVADMVGFRITSSNTTDITDVGIAVIPEPATLGLLTAFGGGILFIRRRFMI